MRGALGDSAEEGELPETGELVRDMVVDEVAVGVKWFKERFACGLSMENARLVLDGDRHAIAQRNRGDGLLKWSGRVAS